MQSYCGQTVWAHPYCCCCSKYVTRMPGSLHATFYGLECNRDSSRPTDFSYAVDSVFTNEVLAALDVHIFLEHNLDIVVIQAVLNKLRIDF